MKKMGDRGANGEMVGKNVSLCCHSGPVLGESCRAWGYHEWMGHGPAGSQAQVGSCGVQGKL